MAFPLAMTTSDHVPCVISIQTAIPKSNVFRFENRWLEMPSFMPLIQKTWVESVYYGDAAKRISAKFKILRKVLKKWARPLSSLKEDIQDLNTLISFLDSIKNQRS